MYIGDDAENALIEQKNTLLRMVNGEKYEEAIVCLNFVQPFWETVGYGYKVKEVRQRIKDGIANKRDEATHHQTIMKWQRLLETV